MKHIAGKEISVCRGDLPEECKVLYDKVAGPNVQLSYPEFDDHFARTILNSINNANNSTGVKRWCAAKIEEK